MVHASVLWAYIVLAAMLIIASVTDVRSGKIYNALTYPAIVVGLIGHTLVGGLMGTPPHGDEPASIGLIGAVLGLLVAGGPLLLAAMAGGVHGGDAKLMAAVGALTGMRFALAALFYGLIVAAIMALVLMLLRGVTVATLKRIGQFLWLSLASRSKGPDPARPDSPKVPLGLAMCIGSAAALVEILVRQGRLSLDFIGV
ncbi:MAG: A24 family peptidase [Planctomycetaceae bacterium]|nr:A24 family peptidase [Planctomycetaceae bacterium]